MTTPKIGNYEIDRQPHAKAFFERLPAEVEKVTWPLEKLHTLRDERLRALIRKAKKDSPWHARRLKHIDPDKLSGDDLSEIPTMTKADLMNNWDEIVTDPHLNLALANQHIAHISKEGPAYLLDEYHVVTSGGSSGLRGVFVANFEEWLAGSLAVLRSSIWIEQNLTAIAERRQASVGAGEVTHASIASIHTFFGVDTSGKSRSFPITSPFSEIRAGLNEFQPSNIIAYPSAMHRLALEQQVGRLAISPKLIICVAEPLLPEAQESITQAFGIVPLNMYGCSECGPVGHSYPGSPGLHLSEDTAVFEPINTQGQPVPPGITADKLLVTNVLNQTLPLIRYELTDKVTFLDEPNPNPWSGRRIADLEGRLDDHLIYPGGVDVAPIIFWTIFGTLPEIFEYQVRQTPYGVKILVRHNRPIHLGVIADRVRTDLAHVGLSNPEVTVTAVDHIARHPATGKLCRFVPM